MKIAIIGLGIIGLRSADQQEKSGRIVRRWNRTGGKHSLQEESLEQAVTEVDAVCLYLKDREAVREIAPRIIPHLRGALLLNHSTIDLTTTLWLAEQCRESGVRFVDAPFTGSKIAAGQGKLFYYLGGDENDRMEAEQIIAPTSAGQLHLGEAGSATVVKLATNLIAACQIEALAEAQALCLSHGINADDFSKVVCSHGTKSALAEMKLPGMLAADYDTHFSLDNMRKDSVYAVELASSLGLALPSLATVSQRMHELCVAGHGEKDYTALGLGFVSK